MQPDAWQTMPAEQATGETSLFADNEQPTNPDLFAADKGYCPTEPNEQVSQKPVDVDPFIDRPRWRRWVTAGAALVAGAVLFGWAGWNLRADFYHSTPSVMNITSTPDPHPAPRVTKTVHAPGSVVRERVTVRARVTVTRTRPGPTHTVRATRTVPTPVPYACAPNSTDPMCKGVE